VRLHASSATCLCAQLGGTPPAAAQGVGVVEVLFETCARPLEKTLMGALCCPCHRGSVDANGSARFRIDGYCAAITSVAVVCTHRRDGTPTKRTRAQMLTLNEADRHEVASILVSMLEYDRAMCELRKQESVPPTEVARRVQLAASEMYRRMHADCQHAINAASVARLAAQMRIRDQTCVELLRAGNVTRRTIQKGSQRGATQLVRTAGVGTRRSSKPLPAGERAVEATHAHLFPQQGA